MGDSNSMTVKELLEIHNPNKVYLVTCATNGLSPSSKLLAVGLYEIFPNKEKRLLFITRPDSEVQEAAEHHLISTDIIHRLGKDISEVRKEFEELTKDSILLTYNPAFQYKYISQIVDTVENLVLHDWTVIEKATRNNLVMTNEELADFSTFMQALENKYDTVPLTRYTGKDTVIPGQTKVEQRLDLSYEKFSEVLSREFEALLS